MVATAGVRTRTQSGSLAVSTSSFSPARRSVPASLSAAYLATQLLTRPEAFTDGSSSSARKTFIVLPISITQQFPAGREVLSTPLCPVKRDVLSRASLLLFSFDQPQGSYLNRLWVYYVFLCDCVVVFLCGLTCSLWWHEERVVVCVVRPCQERLSWKYLVLLC